MALVPASFTWHNVFCSFYFGRVSNFERNSKNDTRNPTCPGPSRFGFTRSLKDVIPRKGSGDRLTHGAHCRGLGHRLLLGSWPADCCSDLAGTASRLDGVGISQGVGLSHVETQDLSRPWEAPAVSAGFTAVKSVLPTCSRPGSDGEIL